MSIIFDYFNYYIWGTVESSHPKPPHYITSDKLLAVKLKPPRDVVPSPARNMPPMDKFILTQLNKAQLDEIMKVKLRKIPERERPKYYEPKHPVLKELIKKIKKVD